jgi:hypothetical protein
MMGEVLALAKREQSWAGLLAELINQTARFIHDPYPSKSSLNFTPVPGVTLELLGRLAHFTARIAQTPDLGAINISDLTLADGPSTLLLPLKALISGIRDTVESYVRDQKEVINELCCDLRGVIDQSIQIRSAFNPQVSAPIDAGLKDILWLVGLLRIEPSDHWQQVPRVPDLQWRMPLPIQPGDLILVEKMMGEVWEFRRDRGTRITELVEQATRYRDSVAQLKDEVNLQRSELRKEMAKTRTLEERFRAREQAQYQEMKFLREQTLRKQEQVAAMHTRDSKALINSEE